MKLLIVDDHPIVREGLAAVLAQAGPDTTVLQASGGAQGLELASEHADLDAVFLDLSMPQMDGMAAIQQFGRRRPDLPVIVLSSSEDAADVRRALAAGALGYVPKSAPPRTLLSALQLVLAGDVYVPPLLLGDAPASAEAASGLPGVGARLTERQVDVLRLVCRGDSNKEIARKLALSDKTVKAHVTAIFRALNVVNRTQAATAAQACGLL
jgi:two-component system, NarL family, nitrate/nitrite response regulator NarL